MKGLEVRKMDRIRSENGFYATYLSGQGLDIGYVGTTVIADEPVLPTAQGIDLHTPGYDGIRLPFPDCSQDFVWSSHCLEHIEDAQAAFREWYRVLKVGKFLTIMVPSAYRYAKKLSLPDPWCSDHRHVFTPGSLLTFVECALTPNSYRIDHLEDNDRNFNYGTTQQACPRFFDECFEIVLIIQKLQAPHWSPAP